MPKIRRTTNTKRSSRSSTSTIETPNKKRKSKNDTKDEYINISEITKEDSMNSYDENSNPNLIEDSNSKQSIDDNIESVVQTDNTTIKKSKIRSNVKKYTKSSKKEEQVDSETVDESQIKRAKEEINILRENLLALKSFKDVIKENSHRLKVLEQVVNDILKEVCLNLFHEVTSKIKSKEINIFQKTVYGVLPNEKSSLDIFDNDYTNYTPQSFQCDNGCGRTISSNRYAPHLEKCAGLSSRLPRSSRRRNEKVKYDDVYSELDSQLDLE